MEKAGLLYGTAVIHTNGLVKEKSSVTKMLVLYPISLKKKICMGVCELVQLVSINI